MTKIIIRYKITLVGFHRLSVYDNKNSEHLLSVQIQLCEALCIQVNLPNLQVFFLNIFAQQTPSK